jgi:hypothetical protein
LAARECGLKHPGQNRDPSYPGFGDNAVIRVFRLSNKRLLLGVRFESKRFEFEAARSQSRGEGLEVELRARFDAISIKPPLIHLQRVLDREAGGIHRSLVERVHLAHLVQRSVRFEKTDVEGRRVFFMKKLIRSGFW